MKKTFMLALVAMAIGFTSCGNKQNAEAPAEQVEVQDEAAVGTPDEAISDLAEQLNAGNAGKFQAALTGLYDKATQLLKENPEVAKEYLAKAQNFLKENADKVKEVVGDNAAVQTIVSTLTEASVEDVANNLLSTVGAVQDAKEKAEAVKEQIEDAKEKVDEVKEKANEVKENVENAKQAASNVKDALGL